MAFTWAGTRLSKNLLRLVEKSTEGRVAATAKMFFLKGTRTAVPHNGMCQQLSTVQLFGIALTLMIDLTARLQDLDRHAFLCGRSMMTLLVRTEKHEVRATRVFHPRELQAGKFSAHGRLGSIILVVSRASTDEHRTSSRHLASIQVRGNVQDVAAESMIVDPLPDLSGQPQERRGGSVGICTEDMRG